MPLFLMVNWKPGCGSVWGIWVKIGYGVVERKGWSRHKNYQKYVSDADHGDNTEISPGGSLRVGLMKL